MFGIGTKIYVFLYGNFLPGDPNGEFSLRNLKDEMTHLCAGRSNGTMYLVKDATRNETPSVHFHEDGGLVHGQIYELNDQKRALDLLDMLDYSPHVPPEKNFHLRRPHKVARADTGEKIKAWVYAFNPHAEAINSGITEVLDIIQGGDWMAYLKQQDEDQRAAEEVEQITAF